MPSPPIESIEINEQLQALGVTKFQKIEAIFQIYFGDYCLLTVDIGKESSKTLANLEKAAKDAEFDEDKIAKLKIIIAGGYQLLLTYKEPKQESESKW
jgi:hypothetical protein